MPRESPTHCTRLAPRRAGVSADHVSTWLEMLVRSVGSKPSGARFPERGGALTAKRHRTRLEPPASSQNRQETQQISLLEDLRPVRPMLTLS